jgi:hypothetical protein
MEVHVNISQGWEQTVVRIRRIGVIQRPATTVVGICVRVVSSVGSNGVRWEASINC